MPVQADGSESTEMACNEDGEIDDVAAEDFDEDQGTVLESPGVQSNGQLLPRCTGRQ